VAKALALNPDQVLYFRARRGGLATPWANPAAAARANVGMQSQQLPPSLWGLAQRSAGSPTATELQTELFGKQRSLVRTWGNRGTVHLYDVDHWRQVIASKSTWAVDVQRNVMPPQDLVERAHEKIVAAGGTITRADLMPMVHGAYLKESKAYVGDMMDPKRLGASRLIWSLVNRGDLCFAEKQGAEQAYVLRKVAHPKLKWPRLSGESASLELARDYLRGCGPASVNDLAHFFGARISEANKWEAGLRKEGALLDVEVATESGRACFALAEDEAELQTKAPSGSRDWPVRLLPLWDGLLMSHADKSWSVPVEAERKLIWKKAAMVSPVVLARGRVVATWAHKLRAKCVDVTVAPLSGWKKSKHFAGVKKAAQAYAEHMGRPDTQLFGI
jgi:DNA glycosylase AlkZ-like